MVCTGNICRSPMAEIILTDLVARAGLDDQVVVDSAGTGDWHVGLQADERTLTALTAGGYDGNAHRARQFEGSWFADKDLILAADRGHERALRRMAPDAEAAAKVRLLRSFDPAAVEAGTLEVDDPYYGGSRDFERCRDEVEAACRGLVEQLQRGDRP